jgi:putative hydrolase of the HAD superfamily
MGSDTPIKAVVFDCFGVLVGSGLWSIYKQAGGDPVADADFIEELVIQNNAGQLPNGQLNKALADKIGISEEEYMEFVRADEKPNVSVFEYIRSELYGKYRLAILSNANTGTIERKIPSELMQYFDTVVVSADVGMQKPDPEIFKHTIRTTGVEPNEALFIDDREVYLPGAVEAGLRALLFNIDTFREDISNELA